MKRKWLEWIYKLMEWMIRWRNKIERIKKEKGEKREIFIIMKCDGNDYEECLDINEWRENNVRKEVKIL